LEYKITEYKPYSSEEILPLYAAVGWTNYTDRSEMLRKAYENSLCTLAAYAGDRLIGIIRAVGDGHSVVFVQDLLVDPAYQRRGIGTGLLQALINRYLDVYQIQLMTDDTAKAAAFYRANSFVAVEEIGCRAFIRV